MDSTLKNAFNHLSSCPCACVCDDFEKGILACGKKETFNCPVAWPINLSLNSKHQSITLLWHFIMEQPVIWDNHLGQFSNYSTDFTLLIPNPTPLDLAEKSNEITFTSVAHCELIHIPAIFHTSANLILIGQEVLLLAIYNLHLLPSNKNSLILSAFQWCRKTTLFKGRWCQRMIWKFWTIARSMVHDALDCCLFTKVVLVNTKIQIISKFVHGRRLKVHQKSFKFMCCNPCINRQSALALIQSYLNLSSVGISR